MVCLVIIISIIAVFFCLRYFLLTGNLKRAWKELEEIRQNPEENRILLFSFPEKHAEKLFAEMNEYILASRSEGISCRNRERKLRAQIENISHDLRTPLTSIIGYLDFIEKEHLQEEDRESFEVIERKARALQSLIGNFYDLSRLELEDYHLSMEQVDLSRFMDETMLQSYSEFEKRDLKVCIEKEPGEGALMISADVDALTRIFYNMNQNALRYALHVYRVALRKEKGKAVLLFENDCLSLTEEDVAHLFERFYVKDSSRTRESSGLGLTINKLLTEAMGGTVRAEFEGNFLRIIYEFSIFTGGWKRPSGDRYGVSRG